MSARTVAVFGSADPRPGDPGYERALEVGRELARSEFTVLTGGYGGVMEAASRGAREAGGVTRGVACAIFGDRRPNDFLDDVVETPDLFERSRELIVRAQGYVVLPGKAGTLSELSLLWALDRAGCLGRRPVVLLGDLWASVLARFEESKMLEPSQLRRTRLVDTPAEAVRHLDRLIGTDGR